MNAIPSPLLFAIPLAERYGLRVHPVAYDGRSPLLKSDEPGRGGCHMASKDPAQIQAWARRWPSANVAVALGGGLFVLDVDDHGPADGNATLAVLEAEHGPLPYTVVSLTPRSGRHVWLTTDRPLRNRVGFCPGLDCRTDGGSAAVPPSRRADGAYRWLAAPGEAPFAPAPRWLLELIAPPEPERRPAPPIRAAGMDKLARYVCAAVNGEARAVASTPPNTGRNARLFQAACRLGELIGAGVLAEAVAENALEAAAHDCGLVKDDGLRAIRATIKSGLARGVANPREVAA